VIRFSWEILESLARDYKEPQMKLAQMVRRGEIHRVIRGLYETDGNTPGYLLASAIYGPSYLSFEYALSRCGLIPEKVATFSSATFGKNKTREYRTPFGNFTYNDVPSKAFPHAVTLVEENGRPYQLASCEKALCDMLYKSRPVRNRNDFASLLFDDLRIDSSDFANLDFALIHFLAPLYRKRNLFFLNETRRP